MRGRGKGRLPAERGRGHGRHRHDSRPVLSVRERAKEVPTQPKIWHGILCMRQGLYGMEALLVQEIDSEGYWKIFASDLGDENKHDQFKKTYKQRVRTMAKEQLSFMASLSFTDFAHLVLIYRDEEQRCEDAPSYQVCVDRLHTEAAARPTFEDARRLLELVALNEQHSWNKAGQRKPGISPDDWQAFLLLANQTLAPHPDKLLRAQLSILQSEMNSCTVRLILTPRSTITAEARRWGPPKGRGDPHEERLQCALREFREEASSDNSTFDLEPLLAPDLSNLAWVDLGGGKPNSLFAIEVGANELMPIAMRSWKPNTSELFLCAWKTASEIRDIVNPAVGAGAVIKHKEIIRELSRRGGGSSSG